MRIDGQPSSDLEKSMDMEFLKSRMMQPESYPHPTDCIELRETHISWVFLTGEFAYKVKKPVDLGFVNFTRLEDRRHYCSEEMRRNRHYCSGIYLGVVPIARSGDRLRVDCQETAVEYAVKMRQFDEALMAGRLVRVGRLLSEEVSDLATLVAGCHREAPRATNRKWGTAERIIGDALENFRVLKELTRENERIEQLESVENWTSQTVERLRAVFDSRWKNGFIRECHGDLHLGNLVRWQGKLTPFDAIEFNPNFFWIDVISEIAFLMMDLDDHQAAPLGRRFVNSYLESTGDYQGLELLTFYLVYRAMVRAKVGSLRIQQAGVSAGDRARMESQWHAYLDMACEYLKPRPLSLTITHGVSGSGKTHGSQLLVEQTGAIRIRSDVERKRLHSERENPQQRPDSSAEFLYSSETTEETYRHLVDLARMILRAGFPVIVDATFLLRSQRELFRDLADQMQVPFRICAFHADVPTLKSRIRSRREEGHDASDANEQVLETQLQKLEPIDEREREYLTNMPATEEQSQ